MENDSSTETENGFNHASFLSRAGALLIDLVICGLSTLLVVLSISITFVDNFDLIAYAFSVISVLNYFAYNIFLESSKLQATFGKMALGIKVIDENGDRISLKSAFIRALMSIVSTYTVVGYFAYFWVNKKQTVHDIFAKTFVIEEAEGTLSFKI